VAVVGLGRSDAHLLQQVGKSLLNLWMKSTTIQATALGRTVNKTEHILVGKYE
jgi:hypothetical protein